MIKICHNFHCQVRMIRPSETDDWVLGAGWPGTGQLWPGQHKQHRSRAERETSDITRDMGLSGDRNTT